MKLKTVISFYRTLFLLPAALLIAALCVGPAFAEGGDGSGNHSGVVKPLEFVSAVLEDGRSIENAVDVPLGPTIALKFDKDVVHMLNWMKNKRCIHLYGPGDREIPLSVMKSDDTVSFTERQLIRIKPVDALMPGQEYTLVIAPELVAKNGTSTLGMSTDDKGVSLRFKTGG